MPHSTPLATHYRSIQEQTIITIHVSSAHARTADSSIKELYIGDGLRRDHRFDFVRLCLITLSPPGSP